MVKKSLFIIGVLLLTGCSAEYKVNIKENEIQEDINIISPNTTENTNAVNDSIKNGVSVYFNPGNASEVYYDASKKETKEEVTLNLQYNFKYNEYFKSSSLENCFNSPVFVYDDNIIKFRTNETLKCIKGDYNQIIYEEVKFVVKTDYIIKKSNAHSEKNNTLTWVFNEDNYINGYIEYELDRTQTVASETEEVFEKYALYLIAVVGAVLGIFVIRTLFKIRKATRVK